MRQRLLLFLLLLFCLTFPAAASAAPGSLDPAFGSGGVNLAVFPNSGGYNNFATEAIDAQGRIVVAGNVLGPMGNPIDQVAVARYQPNGTLDESFATNGVYTHEFGTGILGSYVDYVAVQPDGKIVFAGQSDSPSDSALAMVGRLTAQGALDTTFNSGGSLGSPPGVIEISLAQGANTNTNTNGLALSAQGILIAGSTYDVAGKQVAYIARVTAGGTLDSGFHGGGYLVHQFSAAAQPASGALSPVPQADGSIVFGYGVQHATGDARYGLARVSSAGVLDGAFGSEVQPNAAGATNINGERPVSLIQRRSGDFVMAGSAGSVGSSFVGGLVAFAVSGQPQPAFGSKGSVLFQLDDTSHPPVTDVNGLMPLVEQQNGRLLVTGDNHGHLVAVERFTSAGRPDDSFGNGAISDHQFSAGAAKTSSNASALLLDGSGGLLISGGANIPGGSAGLLARLIVDQPSASFTVSATPTVGSPVSFASTSSVIGGNLTGASWDFSGGNSFADAAGSTATHSFPTPGPHTVALRVTDDDGQSAVATQTISVAASPGPNGTQQGNGTSTALKAGSPGFLDHRLKVRKGRTKMRLSCPATSTGCTGTLALTIKVKAKAKKSRKGHRRTHSGTLTVASSPYGLGAGKTGAVSLKLTGAGLKRLRKAHGRRLRVTAKAGANSAPVLLVLKK